MSFFFFNDTATTEIYTLSLHDALPIFPPMLHPRSRSSSSTCRAGRTQAGTTAPASRRCRTAGGALGWSASRRSEEHTSELQSRPYLVCPLLLEKKKNNTTIIVV